jgi:uncharacterized protein (DUF427 family)
VPKFKTNVLHIYLKNLDRKGHVMDHAITLRKAGGTWTLRAGGAVLAESTTALELTEKKAPPQIYFPCRDVAMALLEPSNHTSHCDHKGTAHYFSIITKSTKLANVASGYANPTKALAAIKDHVTFQTSDQVTVERI